MENNPTTRKSWLANNLDACSLVLGILGTALPIIAGTIYDGQGSGPAYREIFWSIIAAGICLILGFVFAVRGLKTARKKLAIAGIIVCVLSSMFWLFVFGTWLIFVFY